MEHKDITNKFNNKYHLTNMNDAMFVHRNFDPSRTTDLSGKITTTTKEVIKRFCRSPINLIALIILFSIIALSCIVTYTSMYNPNQPISGVQRSIIANLPPRTFGEFVHQNVNNVQLLAFQKAGLWVQGLSTGKPPANPNLVVHLVRRNVDGTFNVLWNPWTYIDTVDKHYHQSLDGTDAVGRDIWTMTWSGTWSSLKLALFVGIIQMILGVSIGAYIGYHAGGLIDLFMMRIVNVINLVPPIIWLIVMTFLLPKSLGFWSMFISLTLIGFLVPVSYTRLYILKIKDAQYLKASHAVGAGQGRLIFNHALPNVLGKLSVLFVRRIPIIILIQTTLAFMGLSPEPGAITLGSIINDAKSNIHLWWYIGLPVAILALITLSLQVISNGLHDAFDPKAAKVKA